MNQCAWHLCQNPTDKKFCSPQCKNKFYVNQRRHRLKELSVEYKGGKCQRCGYDKCLAALEFHHSQGDKLFGLAKGHTRSWERVKAELDKCECLCANCHREVHAGLE